MTDDEENYVARLLRATVQDTGQDIPDGSIFITPYYTEWAAHDQLLGIPVMIVERLGSFDLLLAAPMTKAGKKAVCSFNEFAEIIEIGDPPPG